MPSPCAACQADHAFCVYCQRQFSRPSGLHRHLATAHAETIRILACRLAGRSD